VNNAYLLLFVCLFVFCSLMGDHFALFGGSFRRGWGWQHASTLDAFVFSSTPSLWLVDSQEIA
ncbi:hypothetical protein ACUN9Z_38605, partial [Escherichia sp. HC-CC4]|nr:hypothetical protein [Escherichia coli]